MSKGRSAVRDLPCCAPRHVCSPPSPLTLIDPLARAHGCESLLVVHDGRPLVLADLLVAVNSDHQNVRQRLRLTDGVVVTAVHDVEAAIWEEKHEEQESRREMLDERWSEQQI